MSDDSVESFWRAAARGVPQCDLNSAMAREHMVPALEAYVAERLAEAKRLLAKEAIARGRLRNAINSVANRLELAEQIIEDALDTDDIDAGRLEP